MDAAGIITTAIELVVGEKLSFQRAVLFTLFLHTFDVVSDLIVTIQFALSKDYRYFGISVVLIFLPVIMTSYFDLWLGDPYKKKKPTKCSNLWRNISCTWFKHVILNILQIRIFFQARLAIQEQKQIGKNKQRGGQAIILELVKYYESMFESVPQLIFQLFVILVVQDNLVSYGLSITSIALSLVSVSVAVVSTTTDVKFRFSAGVMFYFSILMVAGEIGVFALALATFASRYKAWVFAAVAIIWMLTLIEMFVRVCTRNMKGAPLLFITLVCSETLVFWIPRTSKVIKKGLFITHEIIRLAEYIALFYVADLHTTLPIEIHIAAGVSYGVHVIGWLLVVFSALPPAHDVQVLQSNANVVKSSPATPTQQQSLPQGTKTEAEVNQETPTLQTEQQSQNTQQEPSNEISIQITEEESKEGL